MNKKSILQITIGIVLAVAVFFAVFLPIKACKQKQRDKYIYDRGEEHYPPDDWSPVSSFLEQWEIKG